MMDFSLFEKKLGLKFKKKDLLTQAFCHRSYLNENPSFPLENNERLEFLGDAVLELAITEFLYKKYPQKSEGELTSWRASLVNAKMLGDLAKDLDFDDFLLLSRGETKERGKARQYILANTLEALVGAIYLDQGYEACRKFIEKHLTVKIPEREIRNILEKLGFQIKNRASRGSKGKEENEVLFATQSSKVLEVGVPTRRLDVAIPEDLIEEIGRIYGYQNIKAIFPTVSLIPPKKNYEIFWEHVTKNILKEAGFTEVYNYSYISEKDGKVFGEKELIAIENPMSVEQRYLRPSLIPNLLNNIQKNQRYADEIKIFELGKIFKKAKNVEETRQLTAAILGDEFYHLKGIVDLLLQKLGISNVWYDEYKPTPEASKLALWYPKKCAEIKVDHEEIGFLGEISPKIIDQFKIENRVVIFDIDFEKLQKLCSEETIYQPISRFPAAVRDLAVLVPRGTKVEEVLNKIEAAGGKLIRDVDLFDVYEGEELPEGKKNLAFHIIYQAENRTLASEEVDEIQNKIVKTLEKDPEWEVRK